VVPPSQTGPGQVQPGAPAPTAAPMPTPASPGTASGVDPAVSAQPPEAELPEPTETGAEDGEDAEPRGKGKGKGKRKGKRKGKDRAKRSQPHEGPGSPESRDEASSPAHEAGSLVFSSTGGTLQLKGRVFALAELQHREERVVSPSGGIEASERNSLDLSLASARLGVEYHSPLPWLSAELELEIAGRPEVKDAYLHAGKRFFARAGQFKVPSATLELESPWTLPLVRRGFIHDLLSDWLDVAGRRPGLAVGYRGKGGIKPRLTLGVFQGTTLEDFAPGDRDVTLIEEASLEAQSFDARAEVELLGVDLAAWYEHRVGSYEVGQSAHYATFGIDAKYDRRFADGGVRLWLDGMLGESFYVHQDKPGNDREPLFVVGRALAAYRFGGVELGEPSIEPFGFFALMDPDTEVVADFASEAALGVNVGYWDRARLTLQGELNNGQRNFPNGLLDHQNPDRMGILLQAGARF
jgi:hypothetical protein